MYSEKMDRLSFLKESLFGKSSEFSEVIEKNVDRVDAEIVDSKHENGCLLYKVCWTVYTWSAAQDVKGFESLITTYLKKNTPTDFKVLKVEETSNERNEHGKEVVNDNKCEVVVKNSKTKEEDLSDEVVAPRAGSYAEVDICIPSNKDENDNICPSYAPIKMTIKKKNFEEIEDNEQSCGSVDVDDSDADTEVLVGKESKAKSRRKGNPRKVYVQLLEQNTTQDTSSNLQDPNKSLLGTHNTTISISTSSSMHRDDVIAHSSRLSDDAPHSSKQRRAASQQAISYTSRLRCDFCCIPFESEFYYDLHMSSHDPDEQLFIDRFGDDTEVWDVDEDLHMDYESDSSTDDKQTKTENEKPKSQRNVRQACEVCGKEFIYQKSFRKHKLDLHADSTCVTCWRTFSSSQELNEHTCDPRDSTRRRVENKARESKDLGEEKKCADGMESNSLQCDICDKWFTTADDFEQHQQTHTDDTTFPCKKCDKNFEKKRDLDAHFEACKIRLQCSQCPKTFGSKSYLRMHERIHDGTCPYYCQACDKYFLKKSKLQRHLAADERRKLRAEKSAETKKCEYKCSFCEKVFIDKRNHTMHERIHKGTNPHYCQQCDHYFLKRIHLVHHQRSVHSKETAYEKCEKRLKEKSQVAPDEQEGKGGGGGGGKFQCISCGEWFVGLHNLKEHLNTSSTCVSYECEICSQKFLRTKQLRRHMVTHTKEKPFACGECNRAFAFKWELTKHERVHSKDKQYPCDRCSETFVQKWELNDHVIWHETGKHPKECPTCGRHFSKQSKLELHIKGVHENIRDHPCTTCGKEFKRKHDLKKHEEFHESEDVNGPNNLTCMICKQKGFNEETLETHQLSHMRVESMESGECKPLSLELLSQFKSENNARASNIEGGDDTGHETETIVNSSSSASINSSSSASICTSDTKPSTTALPDYDESNSLKKQSTIHYPTTTSSHETTLYATTYQDISQPSPMCPETPQYSSSHRNSTQCITAQDVTPRYVTTKLNTPKPVTIQHTTRYDNTHEFTTQQNFSPKGHSNQYTSEAITSQEGSKRRDVHAQHTLPYNSPQSSATIGDTATCYNIPQHTTSQQNSTQSNTSQDNITPQHTTTRLNTPSPCTIQQNTRYNNTQERAMQHSTSRHTTTTTVEPYTSQHYTPQHSRYNTTQDITTQDITPRYNTTKLNTQKPATVQHPARNIDTQEQHPMQHYKIKHHTTTEDTIEPVATQQHLMQDYVSKQHATTNQRADEPVSSQHNMSRSKEVQAHHTQSCDFSHFPQSTNSEESLKNVPPLEMATFKPLSLQSPKPLQVPGLIPSVSQSFGDILHGHTAEASMGYAPSAPRSTYSPKQFPTPDSFFSQNMGGDPSSKQYTASTDIVEKKLDLMQSYSNLESFTNLVNNIQPSYSYNNNNNNNNVRISEPNMSNHPQHMKQYDMFSGLLPPSQSAIYLPHNVDKLLMQHKADYSS